MWLKLIYLYKLYINMCKTNSNYFNKDYNWRQTSTHHFAGGTVQSNNYYNSGWDSTSIGAFFGVNMLNILGSTVSSIFSLGLVGNDIDYSVYSQQEEPEVEEEQEIELLELNDTKPTDSKKELTDILKTAGIDFDSESEEFQNALTVKYNTMLDFAKRNNETLSDAVKTRRMVNYAKAWKFNQFEQQAMDNKSPADWKYGEDIEGKTDAEKLEILKEHYDKMADQYIELYDNNGDGSVDILEMFCREFEEHCLSIGMDSKGAHTLAIQKTEEFSKMSFADVDASEDTSSAMVLYKMLISKFGTLEASSTPDIDKIKQLSKDEIQAYLFTMANYDGTGKNDITANEVKTLELDIQSGNENVANWLVSARNFLGL